MAEEYKPESYLPTIDAILSVADLEQITVKKIRNALQELFGVDLHVHKKAINEVILGRYYDMVDKRAKEEIDEKQKLAEIERKDALLAAKLSRGTDSGPIMRTRKSRTKKTGTSERTAPNNGFNREMILSAELQNVVKAERASRPQVVKLIWAYIKDHSLQNPEDKRQIFCDENLTKLFKKKTVGAFEMNKILSNHIYKPEEVGADDPVPQGKENNDVIPHSSKTEEAISKSNSPYENKQKDNKDIEESKVPSEELSSESSEEI